MTQRGRTRWERSIGVAAVAAAAWLAMVRPGAQTAPVAPVSWAPQTSGVEVRLRGVSAVSADVAWASGAGATVLRTTDGGRNWQRRAVPGADGLDFRDIDAVSRGTAVVLSIGPGEASRIYRTEDGGATWTERFRNVEPEAFFDAVAFGDAQHGAAVSDAVGGRFVVRLTSDGGRTWSPVPADRLPPALEGEGAFAASGTNIAMAGTERIWIGTTKGRVLRSADGGRTWSVHQTPVATGGATGIFSIAFRDAAHGVVVGGNYQREGEAADNVAITADGGVTWTPPPGARLSGFRSVAAWLPGRDGLLAIGPSGSDWSNDDGRSWRPAGGDGYDAFSVAPGGAVGWATGNGGRIARVTLTAGNPRR
jgi:photosystem II stability/assembly factor-like uncharacterized protein